VEEVSMRSFLSCALFIFCVFGCVEVNEETIDSSGGGGNVSSTVSSTAEVSTSSGGGEFTDAEKKTDKDSGPCPSDIYVLWEKDGIEYTIVVEVFCDPIQNLNLGCPAPY
jgi:hypothetical protein